MYSKSVNIIAFEERSHDVFCVVSLPIFWKISSLGIPIFHALASSIKVFPSSYPIRNSQQTTCLLETSNLKQPSCLRFSIEKCRVFWIHQKLNGTESQRTPKEVAIRAIRYSGLGVRSVGPIGDFLKWRVKFFHLIFVERNNASHASCIDPCASAMACRNFWAVTSFLVSCWGNGGARVGCERQNELCL